MCEAKAEAEAEMKNGSMAPAFQVCQHTQGIFSLCVSNKKPLATAFINRNCS